MGHEVQYILEFKRLIWLVAVVFAAVIIFQYFEFPYGNVSSSLFTIGMTQPPVSGSDPSEPSSQVPELLGNFTRFDGSNNDTKLVDSLEKGSNVSIEIESKSNKDDVTDEFAEKDGTRVFGDHVDEMHTGNLSMTNVSNSISPVLKSVETSVIAPSMALDDNNSTYKSVTEIPSAGPSLKEPVTWQKSLAISPADSSSKKISPVKEVPLVQKVHELSMGDVVTVSEMHNIMLHNRATVRSMKPLWTSSVDQELLDAKWQIENAPDDVSDPALYPPLYRNVSKFKKSYELMEKILKVYVYKEGDKPIFHQPQTVLSGIYASEGWFMKHMKESKHFVTVDPKQAHLFYLPFSSLMLEEKLYVKGSGSRDNLVQHLLDYLHLIAGRYDSWNRTGGSDHFVVACHDWGTDETKRSLNTSIRALCNSDVKREGFELGKDAKCTVTFVPFSYNIGKTKIPT
ncbi:probable glycosyltransferase At5g25310 [Rutidosis leptorrhynchoides]|uniref:probable glycosyltransferase At5g25310 n=1 Tax=Rutidosis leptorrhynchoides TaxID=125765 RepID=UPI003A994F5A